jgi:phosphoglycerate dehydrogenase-like enzyme
MSERRVLLVEDDPYPRVLRVILDPNAPDDLRAAFAHMLAHEMPDFREWCSQVRIEAAGLYPCEVRMVASQEELLARLPEAAVVMVESLRIGAAELARAPRLKVVQKYGAVLDNIDIAACAARGVAVRQLHRRANASCAEHALAMMLMLARQLHRINGLISAGQLRAAGFVPAVDADAYDRRVPGSGWARVAPLGILRDSTLGIVGLGEIGRELAPRAAAFGMRVCYTQRHRLPDSEERHFGAAYLPLDELLATADWVSLHVPETDATRGMIGAAQLARMKRGARLINVSRARLVERGALLAALQSGHLGGFALDAQYEEPGRDGDELLRFPNVILTPHTAGQPRTIGLEDFREVISGIAQVFAA